jgi:hypothetical protein
MAVTLASRIRVRSVRTVQVDRRGEAYAEKWKETVEAELKKQRAAAVFKAQPHNLHKEPFVPKPSTKPLVEISNVELHSDRRALEREQFDMVVKRREAEIEANKRQVSCLHGALTSKTKRNDALTRIVIPY